MTENKQKEDLLLSEPDGHILLFKTLVETKRFIENHQKIIKQ